MTTYLKQGGVDTDSVYLKAYEAYRIPSWMRTVIGGLYATGTGLNGVQGRGNTNSNTTASSIGPVSTWKQISTHYGSTLAIRYDGTLWAWGYNNFGQLGLGDTTTRLSPVQVGTATNWKQVVTSLGATLAVKTNGQLWGWGNNNYGQLGTGNITQVLIPIRTGNQTSDWSYISMGLGHAAAIKTNGTLWTWGDNGGGQLGTGNNTQQLSPVNISGDSWRTVSCGADFTAAIRADGRLFTVGTNTSGQMGVGDTVNRNNLMQVGALTTWQDLSVRSISQQMFATKTDGTLWGWGYNLNGSIGTGGFGHPITVPNQIGSATNWSKTFGGYAYTIGLRTDGTLWAWGDNTTGQLGLGDTAPRTVPNQVGVADTWLGGAAGNEGYGTGPGTTFFLGI